MSWGAFFKFLSIATGSLLLTGCILGVIAFISYRNSLRRENLPVRGGIGTATQGPGNPAISPVSVRRIYSTGART